MPNYKGHLIGGLAVYGLILFFCIGFMKFSIIKAIEWLICTLAGSLFPDIDTKSKVQKYFYILAFLFFIFLAIQKQFKMATCCSFILMIPLLVNHRGIFHHPLLVIIIPFCGWAIVHSLIPRLSGRFFLNILFFIAGALSHIWLDLGTSQMMRRFLLHRKKKRW